MQGTNNGQNEKSVISITVALHSRTAGYLAMSSLSIFT